MNKIMINAKYENGKYSLPIKLIGENVIITEDFYLDTGFDGYLKIDKAIFDKLGLVNVQEESVSLANGCSVKAEVSRVKFQMDQSVGEIEVKAVGFGGRNLLGMRFLQAANMVLVIDNIHGLLLSTDRMVAEKIGRSLFEFYEKNNMS